MVEGEIYIIELTNGPISFCFMVMKLYLRPESTEELIFYNTIEYIEPARVDEPMFLFLFQEATP
jgi:hypothetical protein